MISISLVWQSGYDLMESLTGPNSLKLSQALTGKDSLPSSLSWLLLGFNSVCVIGLRPQFLMSCWLKAFFGCLPYRSFRQPLKHAS